MLVKVNGVCVHVVWDICVQLYSHRISCRNSIKTVQNFKEVINYGR